jgi:peroxiredoxin
MHRLIRWFLTAALVTAMTAPASSAQKSSLLDEKGNPAGFRTLAIGDPAPDFALPGIDGKTHRLSDYSGPDVLMILFTSNHCPTSHGIEQRLMKLRNDYRNRSFALVVINPNHPEGLSVNELGYGEYGDSFEEMKPYAAMNGWDFPYLYDGDKQLTARAYGCLATPHVFLFDKQRKLRYAGAFDDSRYPQEETVQKHYVRDALESMFAGRAVAVELTRPFGCSTKWREKHAGHVATEASWTRIPVNLERIDAAGIAALRANPTDKYRLFNVWATWCAPCVEEMPELSDMHTQLSPKGVQVVGIGIDTPANVAQFVKRMQVSYPLVVAGIEGAELARQFGNASGALPYTVLIDRQGRVVHRILGRVRIESLTRQAASLAG